jgi:hypothetical protein
MSDSQKKTYLILLESGDGKKIFLLLEELEQYKKYVKLLEDALENMTESFINLVNEVYEANGEKIKVYEAEDL